MIDMADYRYIGQLVRDADDRLGVNPAQDHDRLGVLLMVERQLPETGILTMGGGELRMALDGKLATLLLRRAHPLAHQALDEGATIDLRLQDFDDAERAAWACHEIVSRRGPPWNRGVRR